MCAIVILQNKTTVVSIEKGELISFKVDGKEYIHQKGNKGWRKSDDEMFPVIGPTVKNNFKVHTKKGDAILDQHGLLRELNYELESKTTNSANFIKEYAANSKVKNSKFPEKSTEDYLIWPFDFFLKKSYKLSKQDLTITFKIIADNNMPFMLGYHPAFLLSNTSKEIFISNEKQYNLSHVYKAGSNAFPLLNTDKITLKNINKNDVEITTKGFNNFMLWTEVDNMLCIEPITHYTSYSDQKYSEKDMFLVSNGNDFRVSIKII